MEDHIQQSPEGNACKTGEEVVGQPSFSIMLPYVHLLILSASALFMEGEVLIRLTSICQRLPITSPEETVRNCLPYLERAQIDSAFDAQWPPG